MSNPSKRDCKRALASWSCANDDCANKWTGLTWILIEKYRNRIPAQELVNGDYIQQKCKRCDNENNELTEYKPFVIEKLIYVDEVGGNKWYRVFGEWDCSNCEKGWTSSYTWISLQKYEDDIPA